MDCTRYERSKLSKSHTFKVRMSLTSFPVTEDGEYTKDQLLDYLKQAHPEGLAIFPAHDFEIQEFASGRFALKVGYTATIKSGKIKDELWLAEANAKTTGKDKGLHYFTDKNGDLCKYVKNTRRFKGTGVFSKLSKSGRGGGFAFTTKALLQLVMLYTGHMSVYSTTENMVTWLCATLLPRWGRLLGMPLPWER